MNGPRRNNFRSYGPAISLIGVAIFGLVAAQAATVGVATANDAQVQQLQQDVSLKKLEIDKLEKKIAVYQQSLEAKRKERITLTNELDILSDKIGQLQLQLGSYDLQIDTTNLEIQSILLQQLDAADQLRQQKEQLSALIQTLYIEGERSYVDILVNHSTFSAFFDRVERLQQVQAGVKRSADEVKALQISLAAKQQVLETKRVEIQKLKDDLDTTKEQLDSQEIAKTYYLTQARQSEKKFQALVVAGKQEQAAINSEIISLEKTLRAKLAKAGTAIIESTGRLLWPVPQNVITAKFHDPDYPFRNIFEHPAIDIRAAQGTPVKAADSGYIGKAKNGGMGYSYIMIVHSDGMATVYGHVSKIYVTEGEFVRQGDIIGASGATPGTPGAGPFTTGPHLHFEVRLNGIPVNPEEYLP
ncbi:MAG: peptidoglycan DD-metalloendopeptidase family protein [Patescibacteria group bacterium]